jgi:hypothetical protein
MTWCRATLRQAAHFEAPDQHSSAAGRAVMHQCGPPAAEGKDQLVRTVRTAFQELGLVEANHDAQAPVRCTASTSLPD